MINWQYFPKSDELPLHLRGVIKTFETRKDEIKSPEKKFSSNEVLSVLRTDLERSGFEIEKGKSKKDKIKIPVLFGRNGRLEKYFEADGYDKNTGTVLEVEAGRGVTNYQFLKDLFQACIMHDVYYAVIAVRNTYLKNADFETVITFFDTFFASGRMTLPLKGILIIGY
jgi:hypothetical protein